MTPDPAQLAEQGKQAFKNKKFDEAAELFSQAAEGFTLGRAGLLAAEMQNNIAWLCCRRASLRKRWMPRLARIFFLKA